MGGFPLHLKAGKPHAVPLSPNTIHNRPGQMLSPEGHQKHSGHLLSLGLSISYNNKAESAALPSPCGNQGFSLSATREEHVQLRVQAFSPTGRLLSFLDNYVNSQYPRPGPAQGRRPAIQSCVASSGPVLPLSMLQRIARSQSCRVCTMPKHPSFPRGYFAFRLPTFDLYFPRCLTKRVFVGACPWSRIACIKTLAMNICDRLAKEKRSREDLTSGQIWAWSCPQKEKGGGFAGGASLSL